jgi:hypothetical protein
LTQYFDLTAFHDRLYDISLEQSPLSFNFYINVYIYIYIYICVCVYI